MLIRGAVIIFLILFTQVVAASKITLHLYSSNDVVNTSELQVRLTGNDTIFAMNLRRSQTGFNLVETKEVHGSGEFSLIFENFTNGEWNRVDYSFHMDGDETRIVISLYFNRTSKGIESLKDLTVAKYYTASNVELIPVWKKEVGQAPIYKIQNNSDSTFVGNSPTGHFYGSVYKFENEKWLILPNSACHSRADEEPLSPGKIVYSFSPQYSPSASSRITENGSYKYVVIMAKEKLTTSFPAELLQTAGTRKRCLNFYTLEDRFEIK